MLEHSPLGASSAERWISCPGSVTLINMLPATSEDHSPDYRTEGVDAHAMAADCLNNGWDTWEHPDSTEGNMAPVQTYLDYVRSREGWQFTELRMHRPEFHDLMYGTTDACVLDPDRLEVIDYKHGIGVVVEVEENPQIMYYAFMVIDELGSAWNDDCPITLTICQPRVEWRDAIRSWVSTVGFIRQWAIETLRPAMERVYNDAYLFPGEHCRFCPAKLLCPAFLSVANRARKLSLEELKAMNEPLLADLLADLPAVKMAPKAIQAEARGRIINLKKKISGWKIVKAKGNRVWKDDAPVAELYGYQEPVILSPAQVEKAPYGDKFVAEWAYSPDAGYDIVHESDKRKEVVMAEDKWGKLIDNVKEK